MRRPVVGNLRPRFWIMSGLGFVSALLGVLTLFEAEWIEVVFGLDPDGGSGALEWSIVTVGLLLSLLSSLIARSEWRRGLATAD
jgi:hypothetical protein